jgi:hypothetical protein
VRVAQASADPDDPHPEPRPTDLRASPCRRDTDIRYTRRRGMPSPTQEISVTILDQYVTTTPTAKNLIDLFNGEWSSAMPADSGLAATPGTAALFNDNRVRWASDVLGGFEGRRVLELGPLEAGHSYMMQKMGAASITAIEANSRAFLKCLCIKEIFGLDRVKFLLGDFVEYLRHSDERYDTVVASGVLYHMADPVELLQLIAKAADNVFIWTHYYDAALIKAAPHLVKKFGKPRTEVRDGVTYEVVEQQYEKALNWAGFCGGSAPTSQWLTRESLLNGVRSLGFDDIAVNFDQPDHPNGPALALCAKRTRAA